MCVVSAVHDHYNPVFPLHPWQIEPAPVVAPPPPATHIVLAPAIMPAELVELRKLIAEFREAVAAAKIVDRLTGQADCVDPDKAKLEERVAALEKRLDAMREAIG